ncbi:MAG: DUF2505 family protein [Candidatus Schekmanbacteria bacterium]|nr:DUF2505 family protein [Candidatus Schekmanbacteria bacterium]
MSIRFCTSAVFPAPPDRVAAIAWDERFRDELCARLRVESLREYYFRDTTEAIELKYEVIVKRTLPDWVRRVIGDIRIGYISEERFDKHSRVLEAKMVSQALADRIGGAGRWMITELPGGMTQREYCGELWIDVPLVGGRMERGLAATIERDYARSNELIAEWVARDREALACGRPLLELHQPRPLGA